MITLGLHNQGDYINLPSPYSFGSTTASLGGFVRFTDGSGVSAFGGSGEAISMIVNAGKIQFSIFNGSQVVRILSPNKLSDNLWHHVVGVRNGTSVKLYVDGLEVASDTFSVNGAYPYAINFIGGSSNSYMGLLKGLFLFDKALSSGEITTLYNSGTFVPLTARTNLMAAYNCNEGSGNLLFDASENSRNGTIINPNSVYTNWYDGDRATSSSFYISPSGSISNSGADNTHTWPIEFAFLNPPSVLPGDVIKVKDASTFLPTSGVFCYLTGTSSKPITVETESPHRTFPNQWKINGTNISTSGSILSIYGQWSTIWSPEVYISSPDRNSSQSGSAPSDIRTLAGIDIKGANITLNYAHVHDTSANGITCFDPAGNVTVNGAISYNNGWNGTDRRHGHGFYSHNNNPAIQIHWNNIITFNNYYYNFQQYTSQYEFDSYNQNWSVLTSVGAPLGIVGASPKHSFSLQDYNGYNSGIEWGYGDEDNYDGVLQNLTIYDGSPLQSRSWRSLSLTDSVFVVPEGGRANQITETVGNVLGSINFARNTYWNGVNPYLPQSFVRYNANGSLDSYHTFSTWQGMGLDLDSTYHSGSGNDKPTTNSIKYYPDAISTGSGQIIIWNWANSSQVSVNLSSFGLVNSQGYKIYNSANPTQVVVSNTYLSGSPTVNIPTTVLTPAQRINDEASTPAGTFPVFGMFLLIPDSVGIPAGAPNTPTSVSLSIANNSQINATWSLTGFAATSVTLEHKLSTDVTWIPVSLGGVESYSITGLTKGIHEVRIKATNGAGSSAYSTTVSINLQTIYHYGLRP